MFPNDETIEREVAKLHASPWKIVAACTGAGAALQELLWRVPDASKTLLESVMPYDRFALTDFIGRTPENFCSADTALWMASAAHRRARELVLRDGGDHRCAIGLGLTASVATGKPKRGEHRVHIALRTEDLIATVSAQFEKGLRTRAEEGRFCDLLALDAVLSLANIYGIPLPSDGITSDQLVPLEAGSCQVRHERVPAIRHELLRGLLHPEGGLDRTMALDPATHLLFPGSFAPLHFGHELMAMQAERMTGKKVVFAITASHPDKGRLDENELHRRAEQFRWRWPALFTEQGALYVEKAKMFPGFGFLIGVDAVIGLLDPKYYGGEPGRDAMLAEFDALGTRFYVVGREIAGRFMTLEDIAVPPANRQLFIPVSGRWDVRSRDLR